MMNRGNPKDQTRAVDALWRRQGNRLDALFSPKSVAIIGASERPRSVGRALVQNLQDFDGPTFLVNPKHREILGAKSYPDIQSVPEKVDLAVIVTPAQMVPGVVRGCASAEVGSAIVLSAGFKECGAAGAELEQRVLAAARTSQLRLVGPNCLGVMVPHRRLNATFAQGTAKPGHVAFISQSGALCTAVLDWSLRENVGFSAFVSLGSMLDVGWGDLITYLGDDPATRSIVCYMESVGDARSFLSAAREVALTKPIIILKVGRTEGASKAAASHTGALTGSDSVLDAAFRRVGVLRVNTIEELFDMAEALAKQPRPRGPRLAIVTNAGGPGALATDALIASGGQMSTPCADTLASLDQLLPPHWSHGNPIDILGDADAGRYAQALELVARDAQTDGLLVILTPQAMTEATATAERLKSIANPEKKPLLASWMGGPAVDAGETLLNAASIPTFKYPDRAARAFSLMWQYSDRLRALYETPALTTGVTAELNRSTAEQIVLAGRKERRTILTEVESKQLLSAYGIPTVETHAAHNEEEAIQLAKKIGFPVAVKLLSQTITHKTDVGGVHLDLDSPTSVRRAWRAIRTNVTAHAGPQHFLGVSVQPMVRRQGYELILGSSVDSQFGPVLLFGAGGEWVEVFKDTALGFPPLNDTLARRLMEQTRIYAALRGIRGRKPASLEALSKLLVQFSQLVVEQRWISQIDLNPVLVSAEQLLVLDARVVLHPPGTSEDQLPILAIRPYPTRYVVPWTLKDGSKVIIRPIRPEDEPLMVKFHRALSERSVYLRYFAPLKLDQRVAHERLSRLCFIDYDRQMALVVERRHPQTSELEILGVGRLSKLHSANEAEFALTVADQWQHHGLGTKLLRLLVQVGRDEKLERITATMLADNQEMQQVAKKVGFKLQRESGSQDRRAVLVL